jgi:hypothetical protein
VTREPAACAAPTAADRGIWDRRWVVGGSPGLSVGALGSDRVPGDLHLPEPARRVLPAFRNMAGQVVAVPSLAHRVTGAGEARAAFRPPGPAAPAPFLPAGL